MFTLLTVGVGELGVLAGIKPMHNVVDATISSNNKRFLELYNIPSTGTDLW